MFTSKLVLAYLRLNLTRILGSIFYVFVFGYTFQELGFNPDLTFLFTVFITSSFTIENFLKGEEFNHIDRLYLTMPLKLADIAKSRYLFVSSLYILTVLLYVAAGFIASHIYFLFPSVHILILGFCIFILFFCVRFGLFYRFAYNKTRFFYSSLTFLILINSLYESVDLNAYFTFIGSNLILMLACVLLTAVLVCLSYFDISRKEYI